MANEIKESFSLQMINNISYIDAHKKIGETTSDNAGNFAGSTGEEHNLESERKKRSLTEVVADIDTIITKSKPKHVYLAFPQESLPKLLEQLSLNTKNILEKSIASNLVKTDKNKILEYFN